MKDILSLNGEYRRHRERQRERIGNEHTPLTREQVGKRKLRMKNY